MASNPVRSDRDFDSFYPFTAKGIREIESVLSTPPFRGIPIGSALASLLIIEFYSRNGDWSFRAGLKNRVRFLYHLARPLTAPPTDVSFCRQRIVITWMNANYRYAELVLPLARQIGYDRCVMLHRTPEMAAMLPQGLRGLSASQAMHFDVSTWRRDFAKFWPGMRSVLDQLSRRIAIPVNARYRLADQILTATQAIAGYFEFLKRAAPSVILADFDRNDAWAPLVLCARSLGIPTYTLVHGCIGEECVGAYPLLADKIFCWGDLDRSIFAAAGLDPARILIGGCPRLTRQLSATPRDARLKLSIDPEKPVVMLATTPIALRERLRFAEDFCTATQGLDRITPVVRLHPSENLVVYADVQRRFAHVRFIANDACSLDEAMAATDVVVNHCSGLGSDALVKGRLTVILDTIDSPLGHGQDLIDQAGCPCARSASELRDILLKLLDDGPTRQQHRQAADAFVARFCARFGDDATKYIADSVLGRPEVPA